MAKAYTWHSGTSGVIHSIWPLPLHVEPDELLSSWIVRLALEHGCEAIILTGVVWPRWRIWTRDLDRIISADRLLVLAGYSGIDEKKLFVASLRGVIDATVGQKAKANTTGPWILALGTRNRHRQGGLQYCTLCLDSGVAPYYRLHWRLAWHTCCARHQVILNDRCFECRSPVAPHLLTVKHSDIGHCYHCNQTLVAAVHLRAISGAVKFQSRADAVAVHGQGVYGQYTLCCQDWFTLARYFSMLLRCGTRQPASRLARFLKLLEPKSD